MYVVCLILCASARLICANGSCYVVLSSSVEGWSQHNNNIILYTHITTMRHILIIWLDNSRSRIRSSSSHPSLCFPVELSKVAFTPCVLVVDVKRASTINTRSRRPRSVFLWFPLRLYNFAPSSHPPRLIVPCVIERWLFSPRFCTKFRMVFRTLTYDVDGRLTRTLAIV